MNEMPNTATDPRLLRLAPADNVFVATIALSAGEMIQVGGRAVRLESAVPLGHKLAARALAIGEKITKYGVPIGSATAPISAGEHVHTHNLQSDYLPTYTHDTQGNYFKEHH